jgi:hypothetical protein
MPQGDRSSYTDKPKRQAARIEAGYGKKGLGPKAEEARTRERQLASRNETCPQP